MSEELTYEQNRELKEQRIGFRYIQNIVLGIKRRWREGCPKSESVLQYYDTETKTWMDIPTKTNYIVVN